MSTYAYAPVRKVPLDHQGIQSSAFSVQLEHIKDGIQKYKEVGVVRNNYLLIPNVEVKELIDGLVEDTGWEWNVAKEYFDGRKFVYTLMTKDLTKTLDVGDTVGLGLNAWNSYDGSVAFHLRFMAFRLECLNGMMSNNTFFSYKFKHDKNSEGFDKEIEKAGKLFHNADGKLETFANNCNQLLTSINIDDLSNIRKNYIPNIPVTTFGKIADEFMLKDEYKETAWDFTNAATRILWHNEKPTVADYKNNQYVVDQMFQYANDNSKAEA